MSYQNDISFGLSQEEKLLPVLKNVFSKDLIPTPNHYNLFDFIDINNNVYVELKSRRVRSDQYLDTMISLKKIQFAKENLDKTFYFVFNFLDQILFWKYNANDNINYRIGGRVDRNKSELQEYAFIPVRYLSKLIL